MVAFHKHVNAVKCNILMALPDCSVSTAVRLAYYVNTIGVHMLAILLALRECSNCLIPCALFTQQTNCTL